MSGPRSTRHPSRSYRPPWGEMAMVALAGIVIIGLGVLVGALWLALIGAMVLGVAPLGLLVPAIKISSDRAPRTGRDYKDMNFVGGAMTVLGIRPTEQDEAAAEVSRRKRSGDKRAP